MTPSPRSGNSSGDNLPRGGNARSGAPRSGSPRTGAPRSGAPRSGSSKFGAPKSGAPKSGGYKSSGYKGSDASRSEGFRSGEPRSGGYQGSGGPRSGASRSEGNNPGAARSGAPRNGSNFGGPRSGAAKTGGTGFGAKSAPRSTGAAQRSSGGGSGFGTRRPSQTGVRPFKNEQYGRNLGPVKNRPTEQNRRPLVTSDDVDIHNADGVRLQKVMAAAGVASRRLCEDMILEGRVQVDGVTVTQLGLRVDPETADIAVDGMTIQTNESMVYMVFNKPKGVLSTMDDPEGRPCISDFLKKRQTRERLFHVGRLDGNTEGLLLLTNDGELSNRLSHPKYGIQKTYLAQVRGPMAHGIGAQLKDGVELEDGWAKVDSFRLVDSTPGHVLAEVVLHSGKNRIVRRMFDAVGYPVERLVRVKFGPLSLGDQRQGSIRVLGRHEVGHLLAEVGM